MNVRTKKEIENVNMNISKIIVSLRDNGFSEQALSFIKIKNKLEQDYNILNSF